MSQGGHNLPPKILIVDDDPAVAQGLDEPLSKYNIKVDKAASLETALYLFNTNRYEVCLLEVEFAPLPGLAFVQKWRAHDIAEKRSTAFVMMTGNKSSDSNAGLMKELGDLETINKPFAVIQLLPYLSRGQATRKRLLAYLDMKSKVVDFYEKSNDFDKAAAQVQKRLPELGVKGLNMLYELYEKANRFEDALNLVGPMLEKDQNNISLLNAKGRLLMRLGRFVEAKECLVKADNLAPQNIERLNEVATAYLHLKDPENSIKKFKEILDLNPEKPDLKFEMFSKLYEAGYDEHAVTFGKETAKPMEIVRHYNNKGVMLSKDGFTDQALIDYHRALRFYPQFKENYRIHFNIALANIQARSIESYMEAERNLNRCLELSPEFEKAKNTLDTLTKLIAKTRAS